jgi:hypothetical protein
MDEIAIIQGKGLNWIKEQFINLQQQNLAILKRLAELSPNSSGSVPDFISIKDACAKYHVSHVTVNNKIKLFKQVKNRDIDRLRTGTHSLINEIELQEALRLKSTSTFFKTERTKPNEQS